MQYFPVQMAVLPLAALLGWNALAQQEAQVETDFRQQFRAQLQQWLPGIGAEKIPDRQQSQQQLQQLCFELGTPGRQQQRAAACEVIAEALGGELNVPARIWLLKQLEYLGREECVAAEAQALDHPDPHVREAARRALANNPAAEANAKLLAKLPQAKGTWRVGLINALGFRADVASTAALAGLLSETDHQAAAAAANALGKIGDREAAAALKAALANAPDALKMPIADAYLRCADRLLKNGQTRQAAAIYQELSGETFPKAIRMAANHGRLRAATQQKD